MEVMAVATVITMAYLTVQTAVLIIRAAINPACGLMKEKTAPRWAVLFF
jgi:hypothetical protein